MPNSSVAECGQLSSFTESVFDSIELNSEVDISSIFTNGFKMLIPPFEHAPIDRNMPVLRLHFHIERKFEDVILYRLNAMDTVYALHILHAAATPKLGAYLDRFKTLSQKAERLRYLIKAVSDFDKELLETINFFEVRESDEPSASEFFEDLDRKLSILENLPAALNQNVMFQYFGVGRKGRRANTAIRYYVGEAYEIWTEVLGRNFKRCKDSSNGKQAFLEFCIACLRPLHPKLLDDYHSDMDSFLSSVLKSVRLEASKSEKKGRKFLGFDSMT